jgi:hypothetical protein
MKSAIQGLLLVILLSAPTLAQADPNLSRIGYLPSNFCQKVADADDKNKGMRADYKTAAELIQHLVRPVNSPAKRIRNVMLITDNMMTDNKSWSFRPVVKSLSRVLMRAGINVISDDPFTSAEIDVVKLHLRKRTPKHEQHRLGKSIFMGFNNTFRPLTEEGPSPDVKFQFSDEFSSDFLLSVRNTYSDGFVFFFKECDKKISEDIRSLLIDMYGLPYLTSGPTAIPSIAQVPIWVAVDPQIYKNKNKEEILLSLGIEPTLMALDGIRLFPASVRKIPSSTTGIVRWF